MAITVTAKDALRTVQITPGWKRGKCTGHEQTTDKTGAALHKYAIEVDCTEEGYPVPVPLQDYFLSEKAVSMGKAFFIACGMPEDVWERLQKGQEKSVTLDEKSPVGKEFQVMVSNEKFENRFLNKATDFLPKNW